MAYSLLLGAVAGTSVWIQFALRGGTLYWVPTLAAIAYYSLAGWGGLQLLRWHEGAAKVALAAVLPQVIQIQTGRFIYSVVCGPQLRIAIDAFGFDVRAGVGSAVEIGMVASTARPTFAINVVAILFAFYLRSQSSRSRLTSA